MSYPTSRFRLPAIAFGVSCIALVAAHASALAQQAPTQRRPAGTSATTTGSINPAPQAPQPTSAAPPAAVAPPAATPATAEASPAAITVSGFRSARFGMTEDEVKAAITKDFKLKPDAIRTVENKLERTNALMVQVPDVLPGGGMAEVSYVFGFETKRLIQSGVTWSKAIDDKMSPDQLLSNGNVLRTHFIGAGYKPETVASNLAVNGGLLMFRGSDAEGRTTLLMLQGSIAQSDAGAGQRVLTPTALSLFYIADAKKPDVYRLPPGSF